MQIDVTEAQAKLSELLAAVDAGEEVIIARNGVPAARLVPLAGTGAARSQDFLYDEDGLPK